MYNGEENFKTFSHVNILESRKLTLFQTTEDFPMVRDQSQHRVCSSKHSVVSNVVINVAFKNVFGSPAGN